MKARFITADVFTDRKFGGNQLAVFPDARDIPPQLFQRITREFNYSETTFVVKCVADMLSLEEEDQIACDELEEHNERGVVWKEIK